MARTLILYGPTGNGKTSQSIFIAKWLYEKYGKITRYIGAESGGWEPLTDSGLVEAGVVQVFDVRARKFPLSDFRKMSDGFWRKKTKDGGIYFERDEKCETKDWSKIGCYFIDSVPGMCTLFENYCATSDEIVAYKSVRYEEEGYIFGRVDKGHVGIIQGEVHNLITKFSSMPIELVVLTAKIATGYNNEKDTLYGPSSIGRAITDELGSWMGDCLHLDRVQVTKESEDGTKLVSQLVAWYTQHLSEVGIKYVAKSRVTPEQFPKLVAKFPQGYIPLGFKHGIDKYLEAIEELKGGGKEDIANWKAEVDKARGERSQ